MKTSRLAALALALSLPATDAIAQTVLFRDDFNRANSNTLGAALVGGTWLESSSGNDVVDVDIEGMRLKFKTNDVDNSPRTANIFAARSSGILRWTFAFDWARVTSENAYSIVMQLGNGTAFGAPPADGASVPGAAINLRWGDPGFGFTSHEGFGYVRGTTQTQLAVVSGLHTIEVLANLDSGVYDVLIDGTRVGTAIPFDKSMATLGSIDALRLYQNEGLGAASGGNKSFDDLLLVHSAATRLVVGSVNGGVSPRAGAPFPVVVAVQDLGGNAAVALVDTPVALSLNSGSGALGGTLTGVIPAGASSVTISGVTYDTAEPGVSLTASRTGGDVLSSGTSAAFTVLPLPSGATTTIGASPTALPADAVSVATITVQLRDGSNAPLTTGGDTVTLSTTLGTLSAVTDRGDGTYTATLHSAAAGTATVSGTVNAAPIVATASVTFTAAQPSAATSLITASPTVVPANGTAVTVTVQLRDAQGASLTTGGDVVTLATTLGSLGAVTDHGDGTYTARLGSTAAGFARVTGTVNGNRITDDAAVRFTALAPSPARSRIEATPTRAVADGATRVAVRVVLVDANGNQLARSGDVVMLATTLGTLGPVTAAGDGTYRADLTAPTTAGTATVSGTVNGTAIGTPATVQFVAGPAAALRFVVEPTAPIEGAPLTPALQVGAVDATGNPDSTFTGTVTLALAAGPAGATLGGTVTMAAVAGVATFPGLVIDRAGAGYVLQATSGTLAPGATAPFEVLSNKVDLAVAVAVSDPAPAPGATIAFTITVTNHGPRTATGVELTDDLPDRVTIGTATPSQGTYDPATRIWKVGTLAIGKSATLTVTATVKEQP